MLCACETSMAKSMEALQFYLLTAVILSITILAWSAVSPMSPMKRIRYDIILLEMVDYLFLNEIFHQFLKTFDFQGIWKFLLF